MFILLRALALAAAFVFVLVSSSAGADAAGLPSVSSGHRPGPDALYLPPATAPQLQNAAPWKAPPILVSGATAYREGEWLYQGWLYDDHGGHGVPDQNAPVGPNAFLFSPSAGTFTYPTGPGYDHNAANLVELRVKPVSDATAFRVTLNTLENPSLVAFTIALEGTPGINVPWPHGAGVSSPAALFLTWHGSTAELLDAATGLPIAPAPTVTVDMARRQIELRVPDAAWNPGTSTVRTTIGVGLGTPAQTPTSSHSPGTPLPPSRAGAPPSGSRSSTPGRATTLASVPPRRPRSLTRTTPSRASRSATQLRTRPTRPGGGARAPRPPRCRRAT